MSLPGIRAVRRALPETRIHLLMQNGLLPLLRGHPDIDELHGLEPGRDRGGTNLLRTALWMRRRRFDAVLMMNPSKFFHLASFLAGVPLRIGYLRKWGFLLNRSIPDTKGQRNLHESQYNLELVRLLRIPAEEEPLEIPVPAEADAQAGVLLSAAGIPPGEEPVAIHPWTSNPAKSWPLDRFLQAARQLRQAGRAVVFIGVPPEGTPENLAVDGSVDLSGRTPLEILPAFLKKCALLLSNDSGPVHVAAAVGTPTVVVASGSHAAQMERWKPLGRRHRVLIDPSVEEVIGCVRQAEQPKPA